MAVNLTLARKTRNVQLRENSTFESYNHYNAQEIITRFSKSAKAFGLKINLKKNEVMYPPPPG